MRVVCIDDEEPVLQLTLGLCRDIPAIDEVKGFSEALPALAWLKDNPADVVLLDVVLPDINGIELAGIIKDRYPKTAVIFLTEFDRYALYAFSVHASGYLLKPVTREKLASEIRYVLRNRPSSCLPYIKVQTFGNFEITADDRSVRFSRARAKEMLAYLIDRKGSSVTRPEAFSILWEEGDYDRPIQKQLDVILRSMRATLDEYGIGAIFESSRGSMRIRPEMIDCDLYRFQEGDEEAVRMYHGEYMNTYSWARFTEAYITSLVNRI